MSQFHYIEDLLELKGVIVTNIDNQRFFTNIYIELPVKKHTCPCCGLKTSSIHDYRNQTIKDIPIHTKPTYLIYRRRRYKCLVCNKRFSEENSFIAKYQHKTSRLNLFILDKLKNLISMSFISKEFHVSIPTVARIMDTISKAKPKYLPKVLSIDEFKGGFGFGKYQCILCNPSKRKVIDIIPTRTESYLHAYFRQYPKDERDKVKYIVIDMWRPYYTCMSRLFPKATIIIDKFHFIRQINWALENVRKRVQKNLKKPLRIHFKRSKKLLNMKYSKVHINHKWRLKKMFDISADLKLAHKLKEDFYEVVSASDSTEARMKLNEWIIKAEKSNLNEFKAAIRAFENWKKPILNSFDHPYTNGFTEGYNNKIKVLKRVSFGLKNFERSRNRILSLI